MVSKTTSNKIKSLFTKRSSKTAKVKAEAEQPTANDGAEDTRQEVAVDSKAREEAEHVAERSSEEFADEKEAREEDEEREETHESNAAEEEPTSEKEIKEELKAASAGPFLLDIQQIPQIIQEEAPLDAKIVVTQPQTQSIADIEDERSGTEESTEKAEATVGEKAAVIEEDAPTTVAAVKEEEEEVSAEEDEAVDNFISEEFKDRLAQSVDLNMNTSTATLKDLGASATTSTAACVGTFTEMVRNAFPKKEAGTIDEKQLAKKVEVQTVTKESPEVTEAAPFEDNAATKKTKTAPASTDGEDIAVDEEAGHNTRTLEDVQGFCASAAASTVACVGSITELIDNSFPSADADADAKNELREKIVTDHVSEIKKKNQNLEEGQKDLEAKLSLADQQILTLNTDKKQLETKLSDYNGLQARQKDLEAKLSLAVEQNVTINTDKKQLETKLSDYEDLQARVKDLEAKFSVAVEQNMKIRSQKKQLETKLSDYEDLQARVKDLEAKFSVAVEQNIKIHTKKKQFENKLSDLKKIIGE